MPVRAGLLIEGCSVATVDLQCVIATCLERDPALRPSAHDVWLVLNQAVVDATGDLGDDRPSVRLHDSPHSMPPPPPAKLALILPPDSPASVVHLSPPMSTVPSVSALAVVSAPFHAAQPPQPRFHGRDAAPQVISPYRGALPTTPPVSLFPPTLAKQFPTDPAAHRYTGPVTLDAATSSASACALAVPTAVSASAFVPAQAPSPFWTALAESMGMSSATLPSLGQGHASSSAATTNVTHLPIGSMFGSQLVPLSAEQAHEIGPAATTIPTAASAPTSHSTNTNAIAASSASAFASNAWPWQTEQMVAMGYQYREAVAALAACRGLTFLFLFFSVGRSPLFDVEITHHSAHRIDTATISQRHDDFAYKFHGCYRVVHLCLGRWSAAMSGRSTCSSHPAVHRHFASDGRGRANAITFVCIAGTG
jgi:hypothetical protein